MIYLASPYMHSDPFVREERYLRALQAVSFLLKYGNWVYAPIVHCHEIAKIADLPRSADFWREYNFHMLARSEKLTILRLEGWAQSVGIKEERNEAVRLGIPFDYL